MQNPTGDNNATESQKCRDQENRNKLTPNPAQESATQRPSPRTPVLEASVSATSNAPTPVAPIRIPNPRAPPCRIMSANTAISTVYDIPTRLKSPNNSTIARNSQVSA